MEIVLENPSLPPPTSSSSSSSATDAQLGLPAAHPTHPSYHRFLPHRAPSSSVGYEAVGLRPSPPLLPADDYYVRTRPAHGRPSSYGDDLDAGSAAAPTVRRVDKSGLLEIAETDPVTCPRPCVLTGAEDDVTARAVCSLRIDRSGLLEAVPEVADQPEEHGGDDDSETVSSSQTSAAQPQTAATQRTLDEVMADPSPRRGGTTLKVDVVEVKKSRVFEDGCLLERPSSLEGQACPENEVDARTRPADVMVLTGSPRTRHDVSKAAERLSHLPFSPGLSLRSLGPLRNESSPRVSPGLSDKQRSAERTESDSSRSCVSRSPEFASVRHNLANTISIRQLGVRSPRSPRNPGRLPGRSLDLAPIDPAAIDAIQTRSRDSLLLAKRSAAEQVDDDLPERAEAEGCEHTTVDSHEEDNKVSFKGSNKLRDNDNNVQTLRVIILSEQL